MPAEPSNPVDARLERLERGHEELQQGQSELQEGYQSLQQGHEAIQRQVSELAELSRQALKASTEALDGVRTNRLHFDQQMSDSNRQASDTFKTVSQHREEFVEFRGQQHGTLQTLKWSARFMLGAAAVLVGVVIWLIDFIRSLPQ